MAVRHQYQVVPAFGGLEFAPYAVVFGINHTPDERLHLGRAAEYDTAAHLAGQARESSHPAVKTGLILSIGRHPHYHPGYGSGRYKAARYDNHTVGRAQQMLYLHAEK